MNEPFHLQQLPVFPQGTFARYPDLFGRFQANASSHLLKQYEASWATLAKYESAITWQLLTGPGICAATHPGADNVFVEIMVGINSYVYNSDCVYINPTRQIFAVSDPPGITTGSRRIFEKLDSFIRQHSIKDNLQNTINRLNREMSPAEGATLSLLHLRQHLPLTTQSFIAGDTYLFQGNLPDKTLHAIPGQASFIGTPHADFQAINGTYGKGDFFLIASDGLFTIKNEATPQRLEDVILTHLGDDWLTLVPSLMTAANAYYRETIYDRTFSRFGGKDNISLLMVFPEQLVTAAEETRFILGGYVEPRD